MTSALSKARARIALLEAILNTPVLEPYAAAVVAEAQHQIFRGREDDDVRKTACDWFWALGYLGGKAAHAALARDYDKALHHTVTAGALLANWHRHLMEARERAVLGGGYGKAESKAS
jgi:hypothetical protein